jgi:AcrR family transcriptional regulator
MQEIADEAGINKALLHYYYRSKDKLFETIFREAVSRIMPRLLEIFQEDIPLEQKIPEFIDSYIGLLMANPFMPGFVIRELSSRPDRIIHVFSKLRGPERLKIIEQYDEGVREGRYVDISGEQFLITLVSSCVFPFVARPVVQFVLQKTDRAYQTFLEERKSAVAALLLNAIRKPQGDVDE